MIINFWKFVIDTRHLSNVMAQDKEHFIKLIQKSQTKSYLELIYLYEDDKDVKIIWNSDEADYKVIRKQT